MIIIRRNSELWVVSEDMFKKLLQSVTAGQQPKLQEYGHLVDAISWSRLRGDPDYRDSIRRSRRL